MNQVLSWIISRVLHIVKVKWSLGYHLRHLRRRRHNNQNIYQFLCKWCINLAGFDITPMVGIWDLCTFLSLVSYLCPPHLTLWCHLQPLLSDNAHGHASALCPTVPVCLFLEIERKEPDLEALSMVETGFWLVSLSDRDRSDLWVPENLAFWPSACQFLQTFLIIWTHTRILCTCLSEKL